MSGYLINAELLQAIRATVREVMAMEGTRGRKPKRYPRGGGGGVAAAPPSEGSRGGVAYMTEVTPSTNMRRWNQLSQSQKDLFSPTVTDYYEANPTDSVLLAGIGYGLLCQPTAVADEFDDFHPRAYGMQFGVVVHAYNTVTQAIPENHFVQLKDLKEEGDHWTGVIDVANCSTAPA